MDGHPVPGRRGGPTLDGHAIFTPQVCLVSVIASVLDCTFSAQICLCIISKICSSVYQLVYGPGLHMPLPLLAIQVWQIGDSSGGRRGGWVAAAGRCGGGDGDGDGEASAEGG